MTTPRKRIQKFKTKHGYLPILVALPLSINNNSNSPTVHGCPLTGCI